MIVILGTSKDDVLYLESKMRNKVYEKFNGDTGCVYFTGTIVGQEVCVAYGCNTNYISSVFASFLIQTFNAPVLINLGMARAFTSDLKVGDVLIVRDICLGDVNMTNSLRVKLTEIPNLPELLISDIYLVNLLNSLGNKMFIENLKTGLLVSTSNYYESKKDLIKLNISDGKEVLGIDKYIALDNEAGGMAVAAHLYGVPFISIKIIQYIMDQDTYSKENVIKALKEYTNMGKIVVSLIAEISSNVTTTVRT